MNPTFDPPAPLPPLRPPLLPPLRPPRLVRRLGLRPHRRLGRGAGAGVLAALAAAGLSACGGAAGASVDKAVSAEALPSPACRTAVVASGLTEDAARSGSITAPEYSPTGDIQAALVYDQFHAGQRSVYRLVAGSGSGSGAASAAGPLVVECVALRFGTDTGATHFLGSWTDLRQQAGSLATALTIPGRSGTGTVAYRETGQSFAGYGIASTSVIEAAVVSGNDFYSVAVAGPAPTAEAAAALLREVTRR